MDLSTTYLGLKLPHPLMPGASPMTNDLGYVRRLEDAGAAAIVMHSLFAEQIEDGKGSRNGISAFFPSPEEYAFGPVEYLEQLSKIRKAVRIPVIASLNGTVRGGWIDYARQMEQAGADAIEFNFYSLSADPWEPPQAVERRLVDLVRTVKASVTRPLAVKLTPFFTSIPHLASQLDSAAVDGLVLFNRFYQPDVDPENHEIVRTLHLSDSSELLLRLRWMAVLSGRVRPSLALSGGVHEGRDAIKAILCGAHAVQVVSALLRRGPEFLREIKTEMVAWMEKHDVASVAEMRGGMSLLKCPDPKAYERANYMHVLQHWRGVVEPPEPADQSWSE